MSTNKIKMIKGWFSEYGSIMQQERNLPELSVWLCCTICPPRSSNCYSMEAVQLDVNQKLQHWTKKTFNSVMINILNIKSILFAMC